MAQEADYIGRTRRCKSPLIRSFAEKAEPAPIIPSAPTLPVISFVFLRVATSFFDGNPPQNLELDWSISRILAPYLSTVQRVRFQMITDFLLAFSLSDWYFEAVRELVHYFNRMSVTQWGIMSACAVAFGFLCLKGNAIKR